MSDDTTYLLKPVPAVLETSERPGLLVQIHGEGLGRRFELEADETTLGRSEGCGVPIDEEAVSRVHCCVRRDGERYVLEDLGSTNGTLLNGTVVPEPHFLADGDVVQIGRALFRFLGSDNVEQLYLEEIHRLAIIDGLTQIPNRRAFQDFIGRELSRCERKGHALALLLIDLDHFKRVNDRDGHLAGDAVLCGVARVLEDLPVRRQDCLARLGGEEFALVLTDCPLEEAARIAERVRGAIECAAFPFAGRSLSVTASIGVAPFAKGRGERELIDAADRLLYDAKDAGRNCVRTEGQTD